MSESKNPMRDLVDVFVKAYKVTVYEPDGSEVTYKLDDILKPFWTSSTEDKDINWKVTPEAGDKIMITKESNGHCLTKTDINSFCCSVNYSIQMPAIMNTEIETAIKEWQTAEYREFWDSFTDALRYPALIEWIKQEWAARTNGKGTVYWDGFTDCICNTCTQTDECIVFKLKIDKWTSDEYCFDDSINYCDKCVENNKYDCENSKYEAEQSFMEAWEEYGKYLSAKYRK